MASTIASSAASLFLPSNKGKVKLSSCDSSAFLGGDKRNAPFKQQQSFSRVSMVATVNASRFEGISMAPPDPILGVSEAFKADTDEKKLNLGVGAYRTEELQPYVLNVVKKVATVQGLSGTGSLRLAAALIERYFPGAKVLISSPSWGNHKNIFNDARVPWSEYRYYDPKTVGLDFEGMIADIKAAPEGSFILLHGCAHNPTGIDPTPEEWEKIADVIQEKNHIPFFDVAYQGFASGSLDKDASSVRLFAARGMELLVAQSYSKNLGLYAERVGAMNVVCSSTDAATRVKSQLKRLARPMYSNPPVRC
ncbi:Aspartate aminotransferase chloroplastic [Bienertia sinuspersici]